MTISEILKELPKLKANERRLLYDRLDELETAFSDETPELLAALDEGIRSFNEQGGISIDQVQGHMDAKWLTK